MPQLKDPDIQTHKKQKRRTTRKNARANTSTGLFLAMIRILEFFFLELMVRKTEQDNLGNNFCS